MNPSALEGVVLTSENLFATVPMSRGLLVNPEDYRRLQAAIDPAFRASKEFRRSCGERALAKLRSTPARNK
jgi:hypothetical protein